MKWFINTAPIILNETKSITDTLNSVLKKEVNYFLTSDAKNMITGILTNNDLLWGKNTKPDWILKDLLKTPLVFAKLNNLKLEVKGIVELHDLNYIPIFRSHIDQSLSNLVGVLDLTEMAKSNILHAD